MTVYEAISLFFSLLALAASGWNLFAQRQASISQRKLQMEANDLQRATSKLAKKHLENLMREEAGTGKARLSFGLVREDNANFRFYIRNIGEDDAKEIELELLTDPENNPILQDEYNQKFPIPRLQPGSYVSLIAALHLGSPTAYNAKLRWTNPDGSRVEEEMYAAV